VKDKYSFVPQESFFTQKVYESVKAGFPSPWDEENAHNIDIDTYLISHPESTIMIKVSGDSMIEAGIHTGDIVIVDKGMNAKVDDIVVAEVDREFTLKYLKKDKQRGLSPCWKFKVSRLSIQGRSSKFLELSSVLYANTKNNIHMEFNVSKQLFAHIDCDCFYASCEVMRDPKLRDKCVCVWGDIIITSNYNARKYGVKVGTPIWEAERLIPKKDFVLLAHLIWVFTDRLVTACIIIFPIGVTVLSDLVSMNPGLILREYLCIKEWMINSSPSFSKANSSKR
jgi:hypothetical protein